MQAVKNLRRLIPRGKPVLFICIGTDRSTGDALGPLVGNHLQECGLNVLGTIDEPVHAKNLGETMAYVKRNYPGHFVVAIDACLSAGSPVGTIIVGKGSLRPGAGVGKELPAVGDAYIKGIVNVGGFMEHFVLQSTRLSVTMRLAKEISNICVTAVRYRKFAKPLTKALLKVYG